MAMPDQSVPGAPAILVYDRECTFCRWALARVLAWDRGHRLRALALQDPEADRLLADISEPARMASWHLITADGTRSSAGRAVAPLLALLPGGRPLAAIAERAPGAVDAGYAFLASNRSALSRAVKALGAGR
jgi:predicted DCC family thiol-disulfide oxidoreductase YuxK